MVKIDSIARAKAVFENNGGMLHTRAAMDLGVHPRTLYQMKDNGDLKQVSRGVFRLASLDRPGQPDLVAVTARIPKAVICLISALAYHGLTSEIPHEVHIALPRGTKTPRIDHPPIRVYRFSGPAFTEGIQTVQIDGVKVQVYCPEKTVVDCFRFRNKIGIDVALEALKQYFNRRGARTAEIQKFARMSRLDRVMRPYIEAVQT